MKIPKHSSLMYIPPPSPHPPTSFFSPNSSPLQPSFLSPFYPTLSLLSSFLYLSQLLTLFSWLPFLTLPLSLLFPSPYSSHAFPCSFPLRALPLSLLFPSPYSSPLLTLPLSLLFPSPFSSPFLTLPPPSLLFPSPYSSALHTRHLSLLFPSSFSSPLLTLHLSLLFPSPYSSPLLTLPLSLPTVSLLLHTN